MCRFKVRVDIVCVDLRLGEYSVCRFKVREDIYDGRIFGY